MIDQPGSAARCGAQAMVGARIGSVSTAEKWVVRYWVHSLRHSGDPRMILAAIRGWVRNYG